MPSLTRSKSDNSPAALARLHTAFSIEPKTHKVRFLRDAGLESVQYKKDTIIWCSARQYVACARNLELLGERTFDDTPREFITRPLKNFEFNGVVASKGSEVAMHRDEWLLHKDACDLIGAPIIDLPYQPVE